MGRTGRDNPAGNFSTIPNSFIDEPVAVLTASHFGALVQHLFIIVRRRPDLGICVDSFSGGGLGRACGRRE